jgi:hypothetical protein
MRLWIPGVVDRRSPATRDVAMASDDGDKTSTVNGDTLLDMTPAQRKLFEIRSKINKGRKDTKAQVEEEHKNMTLPHGKKKKFHSSVVDDTSERTDANAELHPREKNSTRHHYQHHVNIPKEKAYLLDTVVDADGKAKKEHKKEKQKAAFGWDVFNQDSLYNAYKKRLRALPTKKTQPDDHHEEKTRDKDAWDIISGGNGDASVSDEGMERMVAELGDRAEAKKKFSRRRQHYEGEDVDYINERNRVFNKKISRAFDKYTVEIRQNLERGTAI